jgi:DDE superfamily endonuclease
MREESGLVSCWCSCPDKRIFTLTLQREARERTTPGSAAKIVITERQQTLLRQIVAAPTSPVCLAKRAEVILRAFAGEENQEIARAIDLNSVAVGQWRRRWKRAFDNLVKVECLESSSHLARAIEGVLADEPRPGHPFSYAPCGSDKKGNEESIKEALFSLLHSPPSQHGVNRTSWQIQDLRECLRQQGVPVGKHTISRLVREAGFRWRRAVDVLTSKDLRYKEKLQKLHQTLSTLGSKDRFFSIDEYGPFSIGMKGGRSLLGSGQNRHVPVRQQYKGVLIVTAALELSTNQVTHFYSEAKNTVETVKLIHLLLNQYSQCDKLFLSWDSASWHKSSALYGSLDELNRPEYRREHGTPSVELVPLPAGAQFLNVIESVFSGLARAVVHNSDYQSEEEAKRAIDRHFLERNRYFLKNPERAGDKIWREEISLSRFSPASNCKNPSWR